MRYQLTKERNQMKTTIDIQAGDELTLNYFLQDPCKDYISEKCKEQTNDA